MSDPFAESVVAAEAGSQGQASALFLLAPALHPRKDHAVSSSERPTARAHRDGVRIATGTDVETPPTSPYPSLFDELAFLHDRCGMSTSDVLLAATSNGAQSAGVDASRGTLEAGKLAGRRTMVGHLRHHVPSTGADHGCDPSDPIERRHARPGSADEEQRSGPSGQVGGT